MDIDTTYVSIADASIQKASYCISEPYVLLVRVWVLLAGWERLLNLKQSVNNDVQSILNGATRYLFYFLAGENLKHKEKQLQAQTQTQTQTPQCRHRLLRS